MKQKRLVIVSYDAMVYEDLEKLKDQPCFGKLWNEGSRVNRMRTVYPSLTYPSHVSILTGANPLAGEEWGHANRMTSRSLAAVAEVGGPRCCKRNSYLTIMEAVKYVKEHFGVEMELGEIKCVHIGKNNQCLGKNCPFCKK